MKDYCEGWILLSAGGMREVIQQAKDAADWPERRLTIVGGANVFSAESQPAAERAAVEAFEAGKVQFVQNVESLLQNGVIGTPEHVAQRFDEMAEWGVNYLRLTFSDAAQQTYFAERVLPRVQAMSAVSA